MNKLWFSLIALLLLATACKKDDDVVLVGDWERVGDFSGAPRSSASTFTINGTPYICLGYNSSSVSKNGMTDLWRYDVTNGNWVRMADFPGSARSNATAFSIGNKGYVGLGQSANNPFDDFYEYDPANNTWKQVASFPGGARYMATGIGFGSNGYVGTGIDNNFMIYNDFYKFTPDGGVGKWELITGYTGTKRKGASMFTLNNKLFLFGGYNNSSPSTDFHSYDPATGKWTKLRDIRNATTESFDDDYDDLPRQNASVFIINNLAYVALGDNKTSTYEYDANGDTWIKRTAWEASPRSSAVGFYFQNRGFVGTGGVSSQFFDDVWEFHPTNERVDGN